MKLRYFFDPGSGICLWAGDDEAREIFGYPIELEHLPLSQELVHIGKGLIDRFDTSIDWERPQSPSRWSLIDEAEFKTASSSFYSRLRFELGSQYELVDQVNV